MKSFEGWCCHTIGSLYCHSIVSVIKEKLANTVDNQHFHYEPYTFLWKPTVERQESRVYGEIYTSPSFEHAHRTLQESPGEPGCQLPRCVVALMFWSDETHLTSFGKTKLWPVYMFFGNESKYRRCKPSLNLYAFKDFASLHVGGGGPTRAFLAYCCREVYHAQWAILLDDDFITAYKHRIVV